MQIRVEPSNFLVRVDTIHMYQRKTFLIIARYVDENFSIPHDRPGILTTANSGKDSNGTEFFITLAPVSWFDGTHVVFGEQAYMASDQTSRSEI